MLEISGRVGGRMFTYYGHGWYGDLGAMRFPPTHVAVRKYVAYTFKNTYNTSSTELVR